MTEPSGATSGGKYRFNLNYMPWMAQHRAAAVEHSFGEMTDPGPERRRVGWRKPNSTDVDEVDDVSTWTTWKTWMT